MNEFQKYIICVLIISYGLGLFLYYRRKNYLKNCYTIVSACSFENIQVKMDSFDLLFFSHCKVETSLWSYIQGFYYPHVAMLFKKNDKLYVWDADNHRRYNLPTMSLIPIDTLLDTRYKNQHCCLFKMKWKTDRKKYHEKLFDEFIQKKKYDSKKVSFNIKFLICSNYKVFLDKHPNSDAITCSEFCVETFDYCKLLKKLQYPAWAFQPKDLYTKQMILDTNTIQYDRKIHFLYKK